MMGAGVDTSEMFEKLESMRAVVTEVNAQFKNPVSPRRRRSSDPLAEADSARRNLPPSFPS
jgi:hypothetical protein